MERQYIYSLRTGLSEQTKKKSAVAEQIDKIYQKVNAFTNNKLKVN